jgi:predicted enzyme related to lactoylglutathione lyase
VATFSVSSGQVLGVEWPSSRWHAGRATLELSNPEQVAMIDEVEVGRSVSPHLRVAFEVSDASAVTDNLVEEGAEVIAPPTRTPWGSLNARLAAPADLQITVFQELEEPGGV